ncbi:hypothetical protein MPNT_210056 [Candidatus Methylacidithermus pantelleriae]|uniref:Uncharacterized protein n=1 Tax=Candidatus Methylacidithermus pantelleriae TaxID=2744239 RepID=A0A8J2BPR8_9BACT|nr:hypothetical protein MPNT_210056 [Candidatus Methylacidithermus pantelleriae]
MELSGGQAKPRQEGSLAALCSAYAEASNRLVSVVREHCVWKRVALQRGTYTLLH